MKKVHEKKLNVAEMRMLVWMRKITELDEIRNERMRGMRKVGEISRKVQEKRLSWSGREEDYVGKSDRLGSTGDEECGAGQSNDGWTKSMRR